MPSQYVRIKREGEPSMRAEDALVCRNYPACEKAEKEIQSEEKRKTEWANEKKHGAEWENEQKH